MKNILVAAMLSVMAISTAYAGAQQEKMKTCNADAKEKALKGQERKDFMKACLSKDGAPAAASAAAAPAAAGDKKTAQQEKMKTCNAEAKEKTLKGKDRKDFMKTCLSAAK